MRPPPRFSKTTLATLLSFILGPPSYASVVRSDIDYQYFRDFAENKGLFTPGAKNIPIYNKRGEFVSNTMTQSPMPDFSSVIRNTGIATLVEPQYIASVQHNTHYNTVQFGYSGEHEDENYFTYKLVDKNEHATYDYHVPRLHKLVTETAPAEVSDQAETDDGKINPRHFYRNAKRYTNYVRLGSGRQWVRGEFRRQNQVAPSYKYLTGGNALAIDNYNDKVLYTDSSVFDMTYGPMATYGTPGDSGSPLFAYDSTEKKWLLVGAITSFTGLLGQANGYSLSMPKFINQSVNDDNVYFENKQEGVQFNWSSRGTESTLRQVNGIQQTTFGVSTNEDNLANGKSLHLSGKYGTLTLTNSINQGAGALFFHENFTVKPRFSQTWTGAGIFVAKDKQVNWQVANPEGDRLSKIGEGTLYVNGVGNNLGDISVGDGYVVLAQRASVTGQKQAFNEVGIVSGRPTVVLSDANQVNPDNIYFGYRGGRLDVNGNKIYFTRIRNVDDGANIVNHNIYSDASVTINAGKNSLENRVEWITSRHEKPITQLAIYAFRNPLENNRSDYFRLKEKGNRYAPLPTRGESSLHWEYLGSDRDNAAQTILARYGKKTMTEEDVRWLSWRARTKEGLGIYEYRNPHRRNRLDYFILKDNGNPYVYFPLDQNSNQSWQYVGGSREEAIATALKIANRHLEVTQPIDTAFNGYFGEKDPSKPNGRMHVTYDTPNNTTHLLTGGTNINGTFNVLGGRVILSGRQVPYSRIYENGGLVAREVISPDKWINRSFKATETTVQHNGSLYVGRNVEQVTSHFKLMDNAKLHLGFTQGETPNCYRYDYKNEMVCEDNARLPYSVFNNLPTTNIEGDTTILHNAQFTLGKAHYRGMIRAKDKSEVRLTNQSHWTMTNDSSLINLKMENGRITLNPQFNTANGKTPADKFNRLTIYGNLSGQGHFDMLSDVSERKIDTIVIHGIATGDFTLGIKNSGAEIYNHLGYLVWFRNKEQSKYQVNFTLENGYVDLGAYRYRLLKSTISNAYHLYKTISVPTNATSSTKPATAAATNIVEDNPLYEARTPAPKIDSYRYEWLRGLPHQPISEENAELIAEDNIISDELNAIKTEESDVKVDNVETSNGVAIMDDKTLLQEQLSGFSQADGISRYSNTALSDFSSQANALQRVGHNLDRHLLDNTPLKNSYRVWLNNDVQKTKNRSQNYRAFEQNSTLTQLGVETQVNPTVLVGATLAQSVSNNSYDEASGRLRTTMVGGYLKAKTEKGLFASLDTQFGKTKNRIELDGEKTQFYRNVYSLGLNLGQAWDFDGFIVQPSIGTRYNRISGVNYRLDKANIATKSTAFISYNVGLKAEKVFNFDGFQLRPSLASYYIDASHKEGKNMVSVNGHELNQQLGRYFNHELGLKANFKQWEVSTHVGYLKGNEIGKQTSGSLKVGYQF